MKNSLTPSQTQFLIELGWPKPKAENYSIGELIKFIDSTVYIWQITKSSSQAQVVYFLNNKGDGGTSKEDELIDALCEICIEICIKIKRHVLSDINPS